MKAVALVLAGGLTLASAPAFAQAPNDAQIAHIVVTANQVDIDAGKLAAERGTSAEVKAFGEMMAKDHAGVNKLASDLAAKLKVTPQDNPTSQSLKSGGTKNVANLKTLKGAAFDKAYIDNEVAYHKTVNAALEKTLIPATKNADLKALLKTGLKIFQGHEQHAEHVAMSFK
jgi:putative membrane protein